MYYLIASDASLSSVCFLIPSPAILILLIMVSYACILCSIAHRFNEDVVCVKVDGHHYVPVFLLGCEGESSCLVGVDGLSEVVNAEENIVRFGDGHLVER